NTFLNEREKERQKERQKKDLERKKLIKTNKELIAKRWKKLNAKYKTNLPTYADLYNIMHLGAKIKKRTYDSDSIKLTSKLERLGYRLKLDELFSDVNFFINNKGFEIIVSRKEDDNGNQIRLSGVFSIKNAPKDIIELYVLELTTKYRKAESSTVEPWSLGGKYKQSLGFHIKSGRAYYHYSIEDGNLSVFAVDNSDAKHLVMAERIAFNKLKITPWTNHTDIILRKGDKINIRASGSIKLGVFFVPCYPNGISGFRTHNVDKRYNHGSLIGKIGDGDWFYVGSHKIIIADADGLLQLRINDDKESDNDGHFVVKYSVTKK
ncbi:MAG: hypothetical protein JKY02_03290, partial [Flavobacteriaceae bacterium]|nr:hypothetical protein [Flavobacteriaceae bacterium]